MAFWKPGSKKPVVPLSLEVDRDGPNGAAVLFNKNASLSLEHQRQRLPIAASEHAILHLVERHSTVIVIGHTGCGKTTQIPQYLAAAGWASDGRVVACTQPRRIAAQTVAARVAQELRCSLGGAVGYSIRFEDVTTKDTRIKFLTDGVLLREMMGDPLLSKYSVIMVDEAHERSLNTDVLLGLLKKVQRRRRDLRLVIASATVDAKAFAAFFDLRTNRSEDAGTEAAERRGGMEGTEPPAATLQPAMLSVEGRTHHVAVHYREAAAVDFVRAAVDTALNIHRSQDAGDILIFLPGQEHIDTALELLTDAARSDDQRHHTALRLVPLPLYSALPPEEQLRVFEPLPKGHRKVVVATNIAETSITLEGVVYVVDACFTKETCYDPHEGVQTLMVAPATQANAVQRAGRAGRVRPGHCFRVCTEAAFMLLAAAPVPEMQRADLTGTVLQLKALGIDNILNFDWLSPPPAEALVAALELLHALGALDLDARLTTPLGTFMAELPLDAPLAKALLVSGELRCSEEMLTIAAMVSVQSPWISQRGEHLALDDAKLRFATGEGDLVTYLNVFRAYKSNGENPQWCNRNYLKHKVLARVKDIRKQLCFHLQRMRVPVVAADRDDRTAVAVRKAVTAGFFANAVQSVAAGGYSSLRAGGCTRLDVHPSSVLFNSRPPHLVFHHVQKTDKVWMLEVCTVEPDWLTELAPHFYERRR